MSISAKELIMAFNGRYDSKYEEDHKYVLCRKGSEELKLPILGYAWYEATDEVCYEVRVQDLPQPIEGWDFFLKIVHYSGDVNNSYESEYEVVKPELDVNEQTMKFFADRRKKINAEAGAESEQ